MACLPDHSNCLIALKIASFDASNDAIGTFHSLHEDVDFSYWAARSACSF